ncbi:Alpha/Beta hydrolase protein [Microdochium bolleyi]|uniref:Alpha/Beta hydrolase protein n=1 Tax=Microdochium bolleyi TaxID=196109 RepID=A0A136JJC8_9PEZI|nr:Alpha/Beta hydrolase protein [Microdochium bolleyi]
MDRAASLCNATCMAAYEAALADETSRWSSPVFNPDGFYDIPTNASGASPGDLLRWQDVPWQLLGSNWTGIPGGMSLSRIIYMSEDMDRKPIPASAFILLPFSLQAPGCQKPRLRTIAWAHGTTGHRHQCAPSNSQVLEYGWSAPLFYAANGYAVVAPDYAGMGVQIPTGFQYEAGYLHAADISYALVAARQRIGHLLTEDWVVAGHSEGGMTAWRTNERLAMPGQEELLKAGRFLGAVALAPALRPYDLIPRSFELAGEKGPLGDVVAVYLLQAIQGLYPELQVKDWLTPEMQALLPLLDKSCIVAGTVLVRAAGLTVKQIFTNTSWVTTPAFKDWQVRVNGAGPDGQPHTLAAPMLVVQGLNDKLTYPENCIADFNSTCRAHEESISAELVLMPELGHGGALDASQDYVVTWIKELFEGNEPQKGCNTFTMMPVTDHFQHDTRF